MTRFALPYDPAAAPVLDLVGFGFRPAWQPADFIGPRMDCPMWMPAPDADLAYGGKTPPAWIDPYAAVPSDLMVLIEGAAASAPAALVSASTMTWWPLDPLPPVYPCRCVTVPPVDPGPQPAPVSVEAGAGAFLLVAIGILFARKGWAAMGRFGDWFTAERGTAPHQNGWI